MYEEDNNNFVMSPEPSEKTDIVKIKFTPEAAATFISWSKFLGIFSIISFGFTCMSIIGIPVGIFGILASIRLLNMCSDIKSLMQTQNANYSQSAGDNLYSAVKNIFVAALIQITFALLALILFIIFAGDIYEYIQTIIQEYYPEFDPGSGRIDFISGLKILKTCI